PEASSSPSSPGTSPAGSSPSKTPTATVSASLLPAGVAMAETSMRRDDIQLASDSSAGRDLRRPSARSDADRPAAPGRAPGDRGAFDYHSRSPRPLSPTYRRDRLHAQDRDPRRRAHTHRQDGRRPGLA